MPRQRFDPKSHRTWATRQTSVITARKKGLSSSAKRRKHSRMHAQYMSTPASMLSDMCATSASSTMPGQERRKHCTGQEHMANQGTLPAQLSSSSSSHCTPPSVFSDGCCHGNGKKAAYAGIGVYWGEGHPHNVSERLTGKQTNQRAEIVSACRAVETAIKQNLKSIVLHTDSSYVIKAMTEWYPNWERNNWKGANGQCVKNLEDFQRLKELSTQVEIKWNHVPGHAGIAGNEAADCLAKAGSRIPLQH